MTDYKAAKEAFVAGNPGSSVWSINAVSLVGLTAYALYAALISRVRRSPVFDYVTTVLPLLVGVTTASTWPLRLSLVLLAPVCYTLLYGQERHAQSRKPPPPRGVWLDESDSEEETAATVRVVENGEQAEEGPMVQLPSQILAEERAANVSNRSRGETSASAKPNGYGLRSRRPAHMRHNPTPSTHTHTAIEILPTPDSPKTATFTSARDTYPIRSSENTSSDPTKSTNGKGSSAKSADRLAFLSVYRAHMMIMTIHCILAVDFPVFPRWQAKCEDFGTSLMDVGVGSFVFSLGLVSARGFPVIRKSGSTSASEKSAPSAWNTLKKSVPVLALGLIRVMMVKGTDYPEHVTEYGVHWNFFFTLGLLPFLGQLAWPLRRRGIGWSVLGLVVTAVLTRVVHQGLLSATSLQDYTLSTVREGIIGANKEGLVSLPGYLAIYLFGLSSGQHVLAASAPSKMKRGVSEGEEEHAVRHWKRKRSELSMELVGYALAWWSLLGLCTLGGLQVSRRMANLPYALWTAAFNTLFLLGYLSIERYFFPPDRPNLLPACPPLLDAINANSLFVFLVANLATGAVNVSMATMYAGNALAMAVLIAYSAAVCGAAWILWGKRIKW